MECPLKYAFPPQKEIKGSPSQPPFFQGVNSTLSVWRKNGQELRTEDEKKGAELVFKSLQVAVSDGLVHGQMRVKHQWKKAIKGP